MSSTKECLRVFAAYSLRQSRNGRSVAALGSIVGAAIATRRRLPATRWGASSTQPTRLDVVRRGHRQVKLSILAPFVLGEIVPFQKADEAFRAMRPKGVILSGGPASVLDRDAPLRPPSMRPKGVILSGGPASVLDRDAPLRPPSMRPKGVI